MSITSTAKPIIESGAANTAGVGIIGFALAEAATIAMAEPAAGTDGSCVTSGFAQRAAEHARRHWLDAMLVSNAIARAIFVASMAS
jgi:hypothetical protein